MKTRCMDIEPLLMLSREGERTMDEQALVDAHLAECEQCRVIARSTSRFIDELSEVRTRIDTSVPSHDGTEILDRILTGVMKDIRSSAHTVARPTEQRGFGWLTETALEWLIPSVATPVVALLLLLVVQESVDYTKITASEQRLRAVASSGKGQVGTIHSPTSVTGIREVLFAAGEYATADERVLLGKSADMLAGLTGSRFTDPLQAADLITSGKFPALATALGGGRLDPGAREHLTAEGQLLLREIDSKNVQTKGMQ